MSDAHEKRKWLKSLKRMLAGNRRERELGIRDLRWVDARRLPK